MARSRPKTRRRPRSNPRGILRVMSGGYGFVQTAEGEFFVPKKKMGGAFDGDTVELAITSVNERHKQPHKKNAEKGNKPSARVVKVLDRGHETLIGRYEIAEPFGIVIPEDNRIPYDIFTMRAEAPHVKDGDMVRVRITCYPSHNVLPTGVVEEVIGHDGDESLAVDTIIARHKLETEFSGASIRQAEVARVDEEEALANGYRDLRDRFIFTIDPEDARDFDDAISIDYLDGAWRLGVHIADVSHYVPWGSSIDLDARRRATSVYLVDRVIPMLPEELSSDICSLKPHEVRRAMTVDMFLDRDGKVRSYEIYPSLIASGKRLTYEQAQALLDQAQEEYPEEGLPAKLSTLHAIAKRLSEQREEAGGIDFDTKEAKVRLDEEGHPLGIVVRTRTDATNMIEQAMILANITVARFLNQNAFACIYRVHEPPAPDSLSELIPILQEFNYLKGIQTADFIAGNPQTIQEILSRSKGRPESELISSLILRSMKRAVYSPHCEIHYGLAADEYLHFTSPIRRYPDLIVHRMVKALLWGKSETFEQQSHSLTWLAEHSSKMERIAEAASRESQEYKMIEYLQSYIGSTFDAVISGIASYGLFVRLDNTAEGLVHVRSLGNEYFAFDASKHSLTGTDSGKVYRLGQRIKVVLEEASLRERLLDFHLAPM